MIKFINHKDSIAGLEDLVKNRHIYYEKEITDSLTNTGFTNINVIHRFFYTLSIKKFADMYWPGNDQKTTELIKKTEELLATMPTEILVSEHSDKNIAFKIPAVIVTTQKPPTN